MLHSKFINTPVSEASPQYRTGTFTVGPWGPTAYKGCSASLRRLQWCSDLHSVLLLRQKTWTLVPFPTWKSLATPLGIPFSVCLIVHFRCSMYLSLTTMLSHTFFRWYRYSFWQGQGLQEGGGHYRDMVTNNLVGKKHLLFPNLWSTTILCAEIVSVRL